MTFTNEEAKQLEQLAARENKSISAIIREKTIDSLSLQANAENLDLITTIIRTQLKDILQPQIERLASLSAKSCVQSATASFLTAETISKFVPLSEQQEFLEVYESSRKKAIEFTRNKNYLNDEDE